MRLTSYKICIFTLIGCISLGLFAQTANYSPNKLISQRLVKELLDTKPTAGDTSWELVTDQFKLVIACSHHNSGILEFTYWPSGKNPTTHQSYAVIPAVKRSDFKAYFHTETMALNKGWILTISQKDRQTQVFAYSNPFHLEVQTSNAGDILWHSVLNDDKELNWIYEDSKITRNFELQSDQVFLGLGEKTGPLNRNGNAYVCWNTDCPAYSTEQDPMYVSIPFYTAVHSLKNKPSPTCYGIFVDHSAKSYFNFGAACQFNSIAVEDNHLKYYLILGNSTKEIALKYRSLTGTTPLPPKWSLGFHQSRWSYKSQAEVLNLANEFRRRKMPLDVIHLDIDYMDACKVFTFHPINFPNPKLMVSTLKNQGVNVVTILDPGIKIEMNYPPYSEAIKRKLFLTYPNGLTYSAGVWPGLCNFPDFTNPTVRTWWGDNVKYYTDLGIRGLWNDMNEPAAWGREVPTYIRFNREGFGGNLTQTRNVYGMQMARATRDGAEKWTNERVFTLTRAGFAGIQRHAAVWTGDNLASDDHLMLSIRLLNSLSLSGVDFVGADVGGFASAASPELFTRWMSVAAFTPFYRAHKMTDMPSSEPWCFGDINAEIIKHYMQLRYRLMPYLYSSFSNVSKQPLMNSLALLEPEKSEIYQEKFQNEFVLGEDLLVAPAKSTAQSVEVYFPKTSTLGWYSMYSDQFYFRSTTALVKSPLSQLPVFVQAGSIIPEIIPQNIENTSDVSDTLYLHVYFDSEGKYHGKLYDDDGKTLESKLESNFMNIEFNSANQTSSISNVTDYPLDQEQIIRMKRMGGGRKSPYKTIRWMIHGLPEPLFSEDKKVGLFVPIFRINSKPVEEQHYHFTPHFALQKDLYKVEKVEKTVTPIFQFDCPWPENDSLELSLSKR